jgi:putative ABC transport system permease protein
MPGISPSSAMSYGSGRSIVVLLFGGAMGSRIAIGSTARPPLRPLEIVGIAGDTSDRTSVGDSVMIYTPLAQMTDASTAYVTRLPTQWVIRTNGDSVSLKKELERVTGFSVSRIRSMDDVVSQSTAQQDFNLVLMLVFGTTALLLAAVGIYGVTAFAAQERTREIGIRMALGAQPSGIRGMVVRNGLLYAAAGVVAGIAGALAGARLMESLVVGVDPHDTWTFVLAPLLLLAITCGASWIPAARASRLDPLQALRTD